MRWGEPVNKKNAAAVLVLSLLLLQTMLLASLASDSTGIDQGSASGGGIAVSYVDSAKEGYGIMSVSFDVEPDDEAFTVSIDGKTSAPVRVQDGPFAVPKLSVGAHNLSVVCGDYRWDLSMVIAGTVPATGLDLSSTSLSMTVGQVFVLKATVIPADATEKDVVWRSSDPSVATVRNGTVTAVSAGTATITASLGDLSAICTVSVSDSSSGSHTHSWDNGTVTKEPTCTENGIKVYRCSCGEQRIEEIPMLEHRWSEWTVVKEATADEDGLAQRTCEVGGEVETAVIARPYVVDNEDGTQTKVEQQPDGTIAKTTTGAADGSVKVEKVKEETDADENKIVSRSLEITDRDGRKIHSEESIEVESKDGDVVASAKIPENADKAEVVTVIKAGSQSGTISVEEAQIEKAASVQDIASRNVAEKVGEQTKTIRIQSETGDAVVSISQGALDAASRLDSRLEIASERGSIAMPGQVIFNISKHGEVTVHVAEAKAEDMSDPQKDAVGNGVAIDIRTMAGGVSIGGALGGTVVITVNSIPKDWKAPAAYYVDENGAMERMGGMVYDSEAGKVSFETTHCSLYVIKDQGTEPSGGGSGLMYACIGAVILASIAAAALVIRRKV